MKFFFKSRDTVVSLCSRMVFSIASFASLPLVSMMALSIVSEKLRAIQSISHMGYSEVINR